MQMVIKLVTVHGIRAACKVMKTRYSKPFESVQVKIPYETGMDPLQWYLICLNKTLLQSTRGFFKRKRHSCRRRT